MTRRPGFPVDEIRGRLLYESLLAEARSQTETWLAGEPVSLLPTQEPPHIPQIARTDTGTMRAIVVAS